MKDAYVSMPEFKRRFPGSGTTVESWLKEHPERLPRPFRFGGRRYFHRADVDNYLATALPTYSAEPENADV